MLKTGNVNFTPCKQYHSYINSAIHESEVLLLSPVKIPTPYGGRLVWTLPGGNLLIAHIKDKNKIRHKKRWSQVCVFFVLLHFKVKGK